MQTGEQPPTQAIRNYVKRGFSLVPFRAQPPEPGSTKWRKAPLVQWKDRQRTRPSEKTVLAEFTRYPGALIGCVTGRVSDICTLDIDDDEGRRIADDELVPDNLLVPTFRTMSGGLQMVFRNPKPSIPGAVRFLPGLDYRGEGSIAIVPPGSNGNGGVYQWFDGLSIDEVEPPPIPNALLRALNNNNVQKGYRGAVDSVDSCPEMFVLGSRDNDIHDTVSRLLRSGMSVDRVRQVAVMLAKGCNPPFPEKEIDAKIRSALGYIDRQAKTVSELVREFVLSTNGVFSSTDVYHCLQLSTREERKNVSIILKRFSDEGIIERYGNKNGVFRRVDTEADEIDFINADTAPLPVRWPFGIQNLVRILPKNIIVVAGDPNAGKTALLLNLGRLNQDAFRVHYFSSEMGPQEFKERLQNFDYPLDSWKIRAIERTGNFEDVIAPDDLNIIDFLEVYEDFYRIGGMIRGIYDKLRKGIAVIAIQKNAGSLYGLGGFRGMEKARLYLSMENGVLRIVKGKLWADHARNPNGLAVDFKLAAGCKFIQESDWHYKKQAN